MLGDYIKVVRPLSLTCAVTSTLVTTAVVRSDNNIFASEEFLRAITMAVSIQLGANLTNTYFDFVNGVDMVDDKQLKYRLDKALANGNVSQTSILVLMILFYAIGLIAIWPILLAHNSTTLLSIFGVGLFLAFFYTANPVGLKYKALGDLTIFLCFGPLLMQCISMMLTGRINEQLFLYTIPIGVLTEAILHANNSRDIETDTKVGAITLAALLGFENSYKMYVGLFVAAYSSAIYISLAHHWGCIATLITIPIALNLAKTFRSKNLECLPQMTSRLHLPFGILFFAGIMLTEKGFL